MSKRKPRTSGLEWLYHSMNSFNGSGYADKSSAEAFYESYVYYKAWKRKKEAVELAKIYKVEAKHFCEKLIYARDAGHVPSDKQLQAFEAFRARAGLLL